MTDAEFIAWLKSPTARRCLLVEAVASVEGVETTFYLSNLGYVTSGTDTPANTHYAPAVSGGAQITEQLSLDGSASLAFGDIELYNIDGERDDWLGYIWANRAVSVYVGDMTWARDDFRAVFVGVIEDLGSSNRDRLNLKVRDKLQLLNTPVTDAKLGGSTTNAERLLPVCLGEVHNVSPLLIDPALLKYQVHQGAIEQIIEVRDNGVPVSVTPTLSAGTFVLTATQAGQITASVQGDKPSAYANTVAQLVQRLATGYGTSPLVSGDLDATSLSAFDTANPQPVGVYLDDRANVLAVCQELAASVGAQVVMTALGKLRLVKVELPPSGTPTEVTAANMKARTLEIAQRIPVQAAVKLNYCRNYTLQANLQTGIPAEHLALYAEEWLTASASDAGVASDYRITEAPIAQDTLLLTASDAQDEADRRLALWSVPRTVYRYRAFPELLLQELGGAQTITHPRFGMESGKTGQIVGLTKDWLVGEVTVEVLI